MFRQYPIQGKEFKECDYSLIKLVIKEENMDHTQAAAPIEDEIKDDYEITNARKESIDERIKRERYDPDRFHKAIEDDWNLEQYIKNKLQTGEEEDISNTVGFLENINDPPQEGMEKDLITKEKQKKTPHVSAKKDAAIHCKMTPGTVHYSTKGIQIV